MKIFLQKIWYILVFIGFVIFAYYYFTRGQGMNL